MTILGNRRDDNTGTAVTGATSAVTTARADVLGVHAAHRRTGLWLLSLTAALLVTLVFSVGLGPVGVSPVDSARILAHHLFGTALDLGDTGGTPTDLARHD
ncbi:MAG TPA: ABC transporter permease, partial [Corynebacterium variabile]|nr:ABC transporter permease [Corynebacterium variabile]